jgi:hypothetical protein
MSEIPRNRARFYWADGRVTEAWIEPADSVHQTDSEGTIHRFRATEEIEDDGADVYVEEKSN